MEEIEQLKYKEIIEVILQEIYKEFDEHSAIEDEVI